MGGVVMAPENLGVHCWKLLQGAMGCSAWGVHP